MVKVSEPMKRKTSRRFAMPFVLASWVVAAHSSCGDATSDAPAASAGPHDFRLGPNPAGLAIEVGLFRLLPTTLAPSSAVGTLPGTASVDPGGAAHYSMPIDVTPGPRGMAPALEIGYRSNQGNGPLGFRFGLGGVTSIVRCAGAIAYDGSYRPVRFSDEDALCLSGERLILADGNHAQAGAEYRTVSDPFARITLNDDLAEFGSSFTVEARDGEIVSFGTPPASRWIGSTSGARIPWEWSILSRCDRWENCVEYDYLHGPDMGNGPTDLMLQTVRYGGTGTEPSQRKVSIIWQDREDVVPQYYFGALVRQSKLIESIEVLGPDDHLVRTYQMTYALHGQTGRSRIETIELCDAAGVCLPETTFDWTADASVVMEARRWDSDGLLGEHSDFLLSRTSLVGNFDGRDGDEIFFRSSERGKPWLMWYPPAVGCCDSPEAPPEESTVVAGAYPDLLPPLAPDASTNDYILTPPNVWDYSSWLSTQANEFAMSVVDFNGDAFDDVLMPVSGGWGASGDGFDSAGVPYASEFAITSSPGVWDSPRFHYSDGSGLKIYRVVPVDYDGDMYTDVLLCQGESAASGEWVLAHHTGSENQGSAGYSFIATEIHCSAYDEYAVTSVDGGPDNLLVIPAFSADRTLIPTEMRGDYQRLEVDAVNRTARLTATGLPRDRYQRMHDRNCTGAWLDQTGRGNPRSAGPSLDRHLDVNGDGLPDVLRFELASGNTAADVEIESGMLAYGDEAEILDLIDTGEQWSEISLCGADADLTHDSVIAVYLNTGRVT